MENLGSISAWSRSTARQHGLATRAQLVELGLDDAAVARRVGKGWLRRLHRGVFKVGGERLTREAHFLAAVVSFGPHAVLSHRSAAVLWGMLPGRGPRVDVTVPSGGRGRKAIVVHRSPLRAHEVTRTDGIPVTTPARTVLDLAAVVSRRELERAIDEERRSLASWTSTGVGTTRTPSELEERVLALCRRADLPAPEVNASVAGFIVDFAWRAERLIVETDGCRPTATVRRSSATGADLATAGWRVLRVTWARVMREPRAAVVQLSSLLAVR